MVPLFIIPYFLLISIFWYLSNGFEKRMDDPVYVWSKTAPVFFLALLTLLYGNLKTKQRYLASASLFLGAIGDYLIGSSHDGIVPGAVVFGIGHLLYLVMFMHNMKKLWKPLLLTALCWGMFVNYVCFSHKFHTHYRSITVLSIYSLILATAMISSGSIWYYGARAETSTPSLIRFAGYLLFFISDSTLILSHEAYPFKYAEVIILVTYFSSQFLILLATALAREVPHTGTTKVHFK